MIHERQAQSGHGQIDPLWWYSASVDGRPMPEVLAARDVGAVFRFLRGRGWSRMALSAATGMSETRVRAVASGKQQVRTYEVLERVAVGLAIPRGAMGLAYTNGRERALDR